MRKRPLLLAMCVFWLGIVLRNTGNGWLVIVFVILCIYDLKPLQKRIGRGIGLLLIFLLGIWQADHEIDFRDHYLSKLKDKDEILVWGEVYKQEYLGDANYRIYLTDCQVRFQQLDMPCNKIMVYTSSNESIGTILKVKGQFHNFKVAANEGNFHSRDFYQSQKVDFYVEAITMERVGYNLPIWKEWILHLKAKVSVVYDESLPKIWSGVMKGIVLGDKTELDDSVKQLFTASGIVHILTVSGLHISVLGRGLYQFLRNRRLGFLSSAIAAGFLLVGYGFLTGNGVSTLRAIGMMLLFMLAQWLGRSSDMLNSLGAVCLVLLWDNPFLANYTGLWFSVTALIGVGWTGDYLAKRSRKGKGIWMSLGVTLTSLPIVALCYYEIPLYSFLLNCIIIPFLTPVFICGVVGGVIGIVLPVMGKIVLIPCCFILEFYEFLCEWMKRLPFSSVITGAPPVWLVVVYYLFLGLGLLWLKGENEKEELPVRFGRRKLGFVFLCVLILFLYREPRELEITFLDVGQGDGIHIAVEEKHFFIDGGSVDVRGLGEYRILPYLKYNGISEIQYWFITHADTDHISGVLEVIETGYPICNLVLPKAIPKDANYEKLIRAAQSHHINICYMKTGDRIACEGAYFRCIYPGDRELADRNEASLVLELNWEEKKALFTGDISSEVEKELILGDVWLYKAAHHGSKYSNSTELLEVITPEIAVISCSRTNVYGHPSLEAIHRIKKSGAEIYYTMDGGQITIRVQNQKVSVEQYAY